ncbi:MAG: VanZ family protein, partial [Gammaproteobacteria bacterium]
SSTGLQILALGYVAFVVYGSLVPLNFRPIGSFHDALLTFSNIRLFDLGPTKRQDWFANGVLFLPCGLLLSAALSGGLGIRQRFLGALQGFTYCSVLAVGLEFTQQYFPPRTVSLNDLQAEFFGAGVGAVLWMWVGVSIHSNLARLWSRRDILAVHLLSVYGVFYVAISLFPFDIVFTVAELAEKFLIDPPRFFAEISACKNPALCCHWSSCSHFRLGHFSY